MGGRVAVVTGGSRGIGRAEAADAATTAVGPPLGSKPPSILDLLENGARRPGVVRILRTAKEETLTRSDLWHRAETAARWLQSHVGAGGVVAAVLDTTADCIACIFGAFRAGVTLTSLPHPARAMSIEDYVAQLTTLASSVGANTLLIDGRYRAALEAVGVQATTFAQCQDGGPSLREGGPFELVQFTSGSTRMPKGVRLSPTALGANVTQLGSHSDVEIEPSACACNWLPLSHDMGLVGTLFWMWADAGDLVFIPPTRFLLHPSVWLSACAQFSAKLSAAPNFALDVATRVLAHSQPLDLSGLRAIATGAEPVRAASLRPFIEAARLHGYRGYVTPGYGLAEATLGVTMGTKGPWRSQIVDPGAVADRRWTPAAEGLEVVSSGRPMPGSEVRVVNDSAGIGEIQVRGPSLMTGYVGGPDLVPGEWLKTNDLGHLEDGELYVLGRTDDVIVVSGRNLYAPELEAVAARHDAIRGERCVAFAEGDSYVVVAERRRGRAAKDTLDSTARSMRAELSGWMGAGPAAVVLLPPGRMPRTPSGKLQRQRVRQLYASGMLQADISVTFGRRRSHRPATPTNDQQDS